MDRMDRKTALAIAAHPDDIEFVMAGTLLLLKKRGWAIHYFNLSTGNLGSAKMPAAKKVAAWRFRATLRRKGGAE